MALFTIFWGSMSANYEKQIETIKTKGAIAYRSGLSIDSCPYARIGKNSLKFRRVWIAGYIEERDGYAHRAKEAIA